MAVLTAVTLAGVAVAAPAQAAGSCTVGFRPIYWTVDIDGKPNYGWVGDTWTWNGQPTAGVGFQGFFDVLNVGDPINPWTADWLTARGTVLAGAGIFNATFQLRQQVGNHTEWAASAPDWSTSLPTGGHTSFGFQGIVPSRSGSVGRIVSSFSLAGTACTFVN